MHLFGFSVYLNFNYGRKMKMWVNKMCRDGSGVCLSRVTGAIGNKTDRLIQLRFIKSLAFWGSDIECTCASIIINVNLQAKLLSPKPEEHSSTISKSLKQIHKIWPVPKENQYCMFVWRKAADAFAVLTFPISTSEITIAFEYTAHFEKQSFIQSLLELYAPRLCERGKVY